VLEANQSGEKTSRQRQADRQRQPAWQKKTGDQICRHSGRQTGRAAGMQAGK